MMVDELNTEIGSVKIFCNFRAILLIAAISLLPQPGYTQTASSRSEINVAALGPQVGEIVPAFNLPDQQGQMQNLDSIRGANGTMLLFHRSADW